MRERFTLTGISASHVSRLVNTKLIFTFSLLFSLNMAFAQPANDDCNSPTIVPIDGTCQTFDNTNSTEDIGNGSCVGGSNNVWFSFVAQGPDYDITASSPSPSFRPELTLLEFTPNLCEFASANQLACGDILNGTGLVAGNTYYVVVTSATEEYGSFELCVDNPVPSPAPANDDPCAAQNITANGSCTNGTTTSATGDFFNPACGATSAENTVYYTVTLSAGNNSLNINLQNIDMSGTISVSLLNFSNGCTNAPTIVPGGDYCGDANGANYDVSNLTAGNTYYIQVGSSTAGEGDFQICTTESGPPPGCSDNDICADADVINGIVSGNPPTCASGCNIGATSEPALTGCNMATEEVVWFEFTSDNVAGLISLSVTSADISAPTVQVFSGTCNGLLPLSGCVTGSNGFVQIVNESITANTTYFVAISNSFGTGGNFDLCIGTFEDISACVTDSDLYVQPGSPSLGSPDDGPYQPGESVTFCYDINNYQVDPQGSGNNCQWLQGIVPVFGECWDLNTFDPTASVPPTLYGGIWNWYATGINYNFFNPNITIGDFDGDGDVDVCHITEPNCPNTGTNAGQVLPSGWFASIGGANPNLTFGDGAGCATTNGPWNFCFTVTTKQFNQCDGDPEATNCSVKVYTFADGETGSWNGGASVCAQDIPQISSNTLNCCAGPIINPTPTQPICSGGQTNISLTSDQDPNVTYTWEVLPTGVIGASGCQANCGNFITQVLTNNAPVAQTVTYVVTPTAIDGCIGMPTNITVTVLPEIDITIPFVPPVCSGSCVTLNPIVTGGSPPYNYMWDNGISGSNPEVCPTLTTTYSLTITDANQCSAIEQVVVQTNSSLQVELTADPGTQICQNDPDFPITLTATVTQGGTNNYIYNWSPVAGASSTQPVFNIGTDLYCVTITDALTQCTGTECIQVTVDLPPFVSIVPIPDLAECLNTYQLQGVPSGGMWSGAADFSGVVSPANLGEGMHDVTYTYTDVNTGCTDSSTLTVNVVGSPDVDDIPDVNVCDEYILPAITGTNLTGNQSYYNESGGTGISYNAGDAINTTTTLYIFDGDATCFDEDTVTITIIPQPDLTGLMDQIVCNFYILPTIGGTGLTGNEAYFDGAGGTGNTFNAGDTLFTSGTYFIYDDDGSGSCNDEESFQLTVNIQPDIDPMADVEACNFYTLPAISGTNLTGGEAYYTDPNGTGTSYDPGEMINSDITLYIYDGINSCSDEESFDITIYLQPDIDAVVVPTTCGSYFLPAITGNNLSANVSYFSGPNGTGSTFAVGDEITTTTTIYIYDNAGITGCEDEESFTVTIVTAPDIDPQANFTACDEFILLNITGTGLSGSEAYYTASGGNGTSYDPGDPINATTTLYIYDSAGGVANCDDEESFMITIFNTPVIDQPADIDVCDQYILPAISGTDIPPSAAYYTGSGGTGTSYDAGDVITGSTTLYIYANTAQGNCEAEVSFNIMITPQPSIDPIQDATACNSYTLPAITGTALSGNEAFYSGSNGTGTSYAPGDLINSSTTIYIFDDAGVANCTAEQSFEITITQQPDIIAPAPVTACDSYTLEAITGANLSAGVAYYTGAGGTGTSYQPGEVITATTTLFLYDEAGGPACSDEEQFTITINPTPTSDFTVTGPICTTGSSTITFTGNAGANATYNWNFAGGTILSGSGAGPYEVQWGGAGMYQVTLTVEENGCTSTQSSQVVTVEAPLAVPIINCNPSTTSIEFTWATIAGATDYQVTVLTGPTGTQTSPTTYEVTGLTPNTTVEIQVEAIGNGPCGNSIATFSCDAVDCPNITVTIDPVTDICLDGSNLPIALNAVVNGSDGSGTGTWSGPGITDTANGTFDPNDPTTLLGANTITYTFEEVSCTYVGSLTINVFQEPTATFDVEAPLCLSDTATVSYTGNASTAATYDWNFGTATIVSGSGQGPYEVTWATGSAETISLTVTENGCSSDMEVVNVTLEQPLSPPVINCMSSTDQIEFSWSDVPGAISYEVILVSGVAGVQLGNTYTVDNLNPNDEVTITVVAVSNGVCSNSSTTTTCSANNCPVITIDLVNPANDICLDGTQMPVTLEALIMGSTMPGVGTWSGPGITSPGMGTFDPSDASVTPGINVVTFTYAEQGCTYVQTIDINLLSPPTSNFDVQSPICSDQTCTINYMGNASATATYQWDFDGGSIISGMGQGPYEISYTTSGSYNVRLTIIDEEGCQSQELVQTVDVSQALTAPIINCMTTTSSIEFSWQDVVGASDYQVNVLSGATGIQNGNTYLVENLNPDDEVQIEVVALGNAPCGNSSSTQTCSAMLCPGITIFIEPIADICLDNNTGLIDLEANLMGPNGSGMGQWTGPPGSILDAEEGIFDPSVVPQGPNTITYTYIEDGCTTIESTIINVFFPPTANFTATPLICEEAGGGVATLQAQDISASTYNWNLDGAIVISGDDQGPGPIDVTWPAGGFYNISLEITDANGCISNMTTEQVEVVDLLIAPAINCSTTTSMIEFSWADVPGATGYTVNVLSGATGTQNGNTYTVTGLSPNDMVTIELVVEAGQPCGPVTTTQTCSATDCPDIQITIDQVSDICLTNEVLPFMLNVMVFNSDNSGTGVWSGNGVNATTGMFNPNDPSVSFGPNIITYTFTEAGCPFSETTTINIFETPEISNLVGGAISCADPQLSLSATVSGSNLDILWTGGNIVMGANTLTPTVDQPGWYYITATDNVTNCSSIDSIEIGQGADLPVATAGPDIMLNCETTVANLQGGGTTGPNYEFEWSGPLAASQINEQFPEVTTPGMYILTVNDLASNCSSAPDTVMVDLNDTEPTAIIVTPIDFIDCEVLVTNLQGNPVPNATYEWTDESGLIIATTPDVQVEAEGMYFYNILDTLNGCFGLDSIEVIDNTDYPIIFLTDPDDLSCAAESVELSAMGSQTGVDITIAWDGPGVVGPLDELITSADAPGVYTLTLIDTLNGCENDTSVIVTLLNDGPSAGTNVPEELDCSTTEVEINGANSAGTGPLSYEWIYNGSSVAQEISTVVTETGTYALVVTDNSNNCSDTTLVNVTQNPNTLEGALISVDDPSCFGENDGVIYIDQIVGGTPGFEYSLDGSIPGNADVIPGLVAGEYTLTVMDQADCTWDTTFTIAQPDQLVLDLGNDLTLRLGDDTTVFANITLANASIDTLIWSPMDMLVCLDSFSDICREVYVNPLNNLTIAATLTDANGCVAQDQILLRVDGTEQVFIPNAFSPDGKGDPMNEVVMIFAGQSVAQVKDFFIYDRWGEIMFEGHDFQPNDPSYGWDGTLRGERLNPGVFVYWAEVELLDGRIVLLKGDVTLIR